MRFEFEAVKKGGRTVFIIKTNIGGRTSEWVRLELSDEDRRKAAAALSTPVDK